MFWFGRWKLMWQMGSMQSPVIVGTSSRPELAVATEACLGVSPLFGTSSRLHPLDSVSPPRPDLAGVLYGPCSWDRFLACCWWCGGFRNSRHFYVYAVIKLCDPLGAYFFVVD